MPAAPPDPLAPVDRALFAADTLAVARRLVGRYLRHGPVTLRITEVEAYRWPDDSANHCYKGRTARNAPMFGPPGTAYVYVCYGVHRMLNLVTRREGEGAAVLVRAAEPVAGHALVAERRGGRAAPDSLAGPGKVAAGLALDLSFNGHDLCAPGGLEVLHGRPATRLALGPRVGIDYALPEHRDAPWRVAEAGNRWVSQRRRLTHEEEA
ncbi:MAG: DNA-3-methyladenine glycosylase [Myxococcales bacterium]|nr:DNA-3-methyladenine glycosylase [Myxococcales bacterium]